MHEVRNFFILAIAMGTLYRKNANDFFYQKYQILRKFVGRVEA